MMLLANSTGSESGKVRPACFSTGDGSQPIGDPKQVECGSSENMLKVGFRQTEIACSTKVKWIDGLRQRAFHSRAKGIALGEGVGALPLARDL